MKRQGCLLVAICLAVGVYASVAGAHLRVTLRGKASMGWLMPDGKAISLAVDEIDPDPDFGTVSLRLTLPSDTVMTLALPAARRLSGLSMVMTQMAGGWQLKVGDASPGIRLNLPVDFPEESQSFVRGKASVVRDTRSTAEEVILPSTLDITPSELLSHLENTEDPAEGVWTFLDCTLTPLKAALNAKYVLASIADGESSYTLLYIDGASPSSDWSPLDLKGYLSPTDVAGLYDLMWVTADRNIITYRTSATLTGDILLLEFPFWGSSMRFTRSEPSCISGVK